MNNPELYQRNNTLQKRDARQCLEEYVNKIKWKNNDALVIDIGCGDGGVTTSILKTFIPTNYKSLVGCDISENMVQFAKTHYAKDSVSFAVLDIENDLPDHFRGKFDHAFSFYALNWIKHQEKALANIYNILRNEGDCLLMFMGPMPVYNIYRELASNPRWSYLLRDVDRYVSPYHDSQDPERDIKTMMTTIGFTNVEVKCIQKVFIYSSIEEFKNSMDAVNHFKIPPEMQKEFLDDSVKAGRNMQFVDHGHHNDDGLVKVKMNYNVITVYGKKLIC